MMFCDLQDKILQKFPPFDPLWPVEAQDSWFIGLERLTRFIADGEGEGEGEVYQQPTTRTVFLDTQGKIRDGRWQQAKEDAFKLLQSGKSVAAVFRQLKAKYQEICPALTTIIKWRDDGYYDGSLEKKTGGRPHISQRVRDRALELYADGKKPDDIYLCLDEEFGAEAPSTPTTIYKWLKDKGNVDKQKTPKTSNEVGSFFECLHSTKFPISEYACIDYQRQWRKSEPSSHRHAKLQKCQECQHWIDDVGILRGKE